MIRRIAMVAGIVFVVLIVTRPQTAAAIGSSAIDEALMWANNAGTFLAALVT